MNRTAAAAALLVALLAAPDGAPRASAAGPNPTIASVSPSKGPSAGGTSVTITGTDFVAPMQATFGGIAATNVVVVSPTELTCVTAAHVRGVVDVVVSQTTAPISTSAPAVAAFTFEDPPSRIWVPRANGTATGGNPGGFDVTIVDAANRTVSGSLELNAADPDLPADDDWRVTQVLFDATGDTAFLATAGTPGRLDSRKVFVVRTARAAGLEPGNPVLAVLDTGGNPYQLALNATGTLLYAADGGSWQGSATSLPAGTFRAWDVTDRANPSALGSPVAVGVLPVLSWDASSHQGWGTNSAFKGLVQAKNGRCVVTNVGSHTLSVVDVANLVVTDTEDVGVSGGLPLQLSNSVPSPFSDDFVFVETTDVISSTTDYFLYRISTASLVPKGRVTVPVQFFPVLPAPDPAGRMAWPHPDGESLVVPAAAEASVAAFNPATGGAAARTAIQGGGPAASLAFNDVSGLLYAREADGGWTVFSVPAGRGAAPAEAKKVDDATGLGSLRVIMGGSTLVAAGASKLALIDGTAAGATAHTVIATVDLPLNPLGGPSFPQPASTWAARTYVTPPSATGPRLVFPLAGTVFCDAASPPDLEVAGSAGSGHLEVELGTQYDFLRAPGAPRGRFRVPAGATTVRPPAALWRKVLRAAAGSVERPFYARVNAVSRTGFRTWGVTASFRVCAPVPPTLSAPADGGAATMGAPPALSFDPLGPGRVRVEFAGPGGFADGVNAAFRVRAAAGGTTTATVPAGTWGNAAERARRQNGDTLPVDVFWRVLVRDDLGRWVPSATRRLVLGP